MTTTQLDRPRFRLAFEQLNAAERAASAILLGTSLLGILLGFLLLVRNSIDALSMPYLTVLGVAFGVSAVAQRVRGGTWPRDLVTIVVACAICLLLLFAAPEYLYGHELNAIVHRSFFSTWLVLGTATVATSVSLKRALGGTPSAEDTGRYILLFVPIAIVFLAYGVVLVHLVDRGIDGLRWHVITTPYSETLEGVTLQQQAGLRNSVLGTFMLVGMTTAVSFFPGVAAGVYMNEYPGRMAHLVRFSTTMLRAIAPFILGVAAFGLVQAVAGRGADDQISKLIRGYYTDANGFAFASKGSFLTAAAFLSLLVMPVIARSTEEGLRSVPNDIREGSVALGATEGHGLLRILLPWAAPNIVTAVLLGAAEAAGSVAVLLLIAGTGQNGVGPFKEATSLSFVIFEGRYGPKNFQESMAQYQFTAALLLVILTLSLTVSALYLKSRLGRRYRASLTTE